MRGPDIKAMKNRTRMPLRDCEQVRVDVGDASVAVTCMARQVLRRASRDPPRFVRWTSHMESLSG